MPEPSVSLESYPDRFLTCRTINHPWREDGLPWVEVKVVGGVEAQVVYEKLTCARCSNVRIDQRTMQGRLIRRAYRHAPQYRLSPELRHKETLAGERISRLLANVQRTATA